LTRDKKMFEEVVRRVRVLSDLLSEHKTPILEPSHNCMDCQYYQRCFIPKKNSKQFSLSEILGLSKEN
jgi:CRISPR-associated exonuclease Cas4